MTIADNAQNLYLVNLYLVASLLHVIGLQQICMLPIQWWQLAHILECHGVCSFWQVCFSIISMSLSFQIHL